MFVWKITGSQRLLIIEKRRFRLQRLNSKFLRPRQRKILIFVYKAFWNIWEFGISCWDPNSETWDPKTPPNSIQSRRRDVRYAPSAIFLFSSVRTDWLTNPTHISKTLTDRLATLVEMEIDETCTILAKEISEFY